MQRHLPGPFGVTHRLFSVREGFTVVVVVVVLVVVSFKPIFHRLADAVTKHTHTGSNAVFLCNVVLMLTVTRL